MTTQLLWGTRQPAVALTDYEFKLKKMYHVHFTDGGISSESSGPDGEPETDGMYLYVVCKTNLSNESISITYTGIDDQSYTIPVGGSLDLTLKKKGDIVRITNAIDLQTITKVLAKNVTSVTRIAGGIEKQELEIWGIDSDIPFMSLPQPPPFEPQFEPVVKTNVLLNGKYDTKFQGFRLNATLSYEKLTTEETKPFVDIFNYGGHFYLFPHFLEAPSIKFKVFWENTWNFSHWQNKRRFYAVSEITLRGVELIDKLPKPLELPTDYTGYWSSIYARIDNDDARFWDGEEPYIRGDLIWTPKKAFNLQYLGSEDECPLVISKCHIETHPGDVTDINMNLSRQLNSLLKDGNMERPDLGPWTGNPTTTISKDKTFFKFGKQSLKFIGVGDQDNRYQEFTAQGGDNLHYELWVYKSASSTANVSIECWNQTDSEYIFANTDAPGTNTWYKITVDFKVGGSGTKILYMRFRQTSGGYTLYWFDNIRLVPNKFNNPGFEGTYIEGVAPNWIKNGSPTCQSSTEKHTGTCAQIITNSASASDSVDQTITGLTIGEWYTIKIFLRKLSGTGNVIAELTRAGDKVLSTNSSSYQELDYTFKASSTLATITLYNDNAGVVGLFDDVAIYEACPETIGDLIEVIDGLTDYSATAQADETDFDGTMERHYNADAGSDNLEKAEVLDIKTSAVTLYW